MAMRSQQKKTNRGGRRKRATPSIATRRERVESKEGAIVGAAYEIFADKGFGQSTMSEIANKAGVAEGTVYLYFNNKAALAGGVIAKFYDQLTEAAQVGVNNAETTEEKLRFLARLHLTRIMDERRILDLLNVVDRNTEAHIGGAIYELNKHYVAIFDGVIRDGVWRGDVSEDYDNWILRDVFYGGLEYAMRTMLITDRRGELEKFVDQIVRMIIARPAGEKEDKSDRAEIRLAQLTRRLEKAVESAESALPSRGKNTR